MIYQPLKLSVRDFQRLISKYLAKRNPFFPVTRRVFPKMWSQELVSVQPMTKPSGLLFYLDYTYGTKTSGSKDENDENRSEKCADFLPDESGTHEESSETEEVSGRSKSEVPRRTIAPKKKT